MCQRLADLRRLRNFAPELERAIAAAEKRIERLPLKAALEALDKNELQQEIVGLARARALIELAREVPAVRADLEGLVQAESETEIPGAILVTVLAQEVDRFRRNPTLLREAFTDTARNQLQDASLRLLMHGLSTDHEVLAAGAIQVALLLGGAQALADVQAHLRGHDLIAKASSEAVAVEILLFAVSESQNVFALDALDELASSWGTEVLRESAVRLRTALTTSADATTLNMS